MKKVILALGCVMWSLEWGVSLTLTGIREQTYLYAGCSVPDHRHEGIGISGTDRRVGARGTSWCWDDGVRVTGRAHGVAASRKMRLVISLVQLHLRLQGI